MVIEVKWNSQHTTEMQVVQGQIVKNDFCIPWILMTFQGTPPTRESQSCIKVISSFKQSRSRDDEDADFLEKAQNIFNLCDSTKNLSCHMFNIFCRFSPSVLHKLEMGATFDYQEGRFFCTVCMV